MRRLSNQYIGIDQGERVLFSDFEDGGPMWTSEGPREVRAWVEFSEKFQSPPVVHVSLSMWDMDNKGNARADIKADGITESGFSVVFRTWGDTRIARVRSSWMAIGELHHMDDWDLY